MQLKRIIAAAVAIATIGLLSACATEGQHAPSATGKDGGKEQCVYTTGSNLCRKVPSGS